MAQAARAAFRPVGVGNIMYSLLHKSAQHKTSTSFYRLYQTFVPKPTYQSFPNVKQKCSKTIWQTQSVRGGLLFRQTVGEPVLCFRFYSAGLQKQMPALTAKRPARKKTPRVKEDAKEHVNNVVAYAVAEELDLSQLRKALTVQGLYQICDLPVDVLDAVYVKAKYTVDETHREIFFFRDGSAVFWSMPEVERGEVLKSLVKHSLEPYDRSLVIHEREEMDLLYIKSATGLLGDTIQMNGEIEEGQMTLEKYAFSNALAQSVKLSIWEAFLERMVDSIESVTEDLRDGGKIRLSRRSVLRKTGELFALRHLINLSSDLLDTPDFYWDRATLEPLYLCVYNHLAISRRTRVMNERLSHCCELTDLLSSQLNDAHHTRLEVMIIILILVEVAFETVHYIERYLDHKSQAEGTKKPHRDTVSLVVPYPPAMG